MVVHGDIVCAFQSGRGNRNSIVCRRFPDILKSLRKTHIRRDDLLHYDLREEQQRNEHTEIDRSKNGEIASCLRTFGFPVKLEGDEACK